MQMLIVTTDRISLLFLFWPWHQTEQMVSAQAQRAWVNNIQFYFLFVGHLMEKSMIMQHGKFSGSA